MNYFSSLSFSREAQKDIHLFNAYPLITSKYNYAFQKVYDELKKAQFSIFIKPIPFQFVTIIAIGLILYTLYDLKISSAIGVSSVVVLLQSIFILNDRMEGVIQHGSLLYEILDYLKKYFSFIEYSDDIKDGDLEITQIKNIQFVNISFKYPKTQTNILEHISFLAKEGESIAIVGHNGAGKSTLVQLLCRFWDVTEGEILVNGQDIRSYKLSELRNCIGAVFQDFFKFNMTINENIMLSEKPTPNSEKVREVLGLPSNFDLETFVGKSYEGIEFSGGQWQKLAIIRCFNTNSSMIILDEPTSAIDPKAEVKLYNDFQSLSSGKLSFMITHRLGSINGVDRVLVIDKGNLVQDGSPEILKRSNGVFNELWSIQSDMYK